MLKLREYIDMDYKEKEHTKLKDMQIKGNSEEVL